MSAIAQALTAALLHFIWQGAVVAFLLWVALFALRKRSAQARYLAALAALEVLGVLPVVTAVRVYRSPPSSAFIVTSAAAIPAEILKVAVQQAAASGGWLAALQTWAMPVWSLGVLIFALRAVWGCGRVSMMRRRGKPASSELLARVAEIAARMGLARPAQVLVTSFAGCPSVVGWFRPVILLPAATLLGLTQEQLEAVLAHELAHIRRYDSLVNAAQILVETLLFYHPAVWWTSARIREERELCCDDLAVSSCGNALCYARALTRLERLRVTAPSMALGSAGGPLAYRIRRLMGTETDRTRPEESGRGSQEWLRHGGASKLPGVLALALGVVCLAGNIHWARAQEQKMVVPQTPPVVDNQSNRVLIWNPLPPKREFVGPQSDRVLLWTPVPQATPDQDAQRAELEVLRRRVRELEAQLNDQKAQDMAARVAEDLSQQANRLAAAKALQEANLNNLKLLLGQMRQKYKDDYPGIQDMERQIEQAQSAIMESEYQLSHADEAKKRLAVIQSQRMADIQNKLRAERLTQQLRERSLQMQAQSNWTVKSIDIDGLSGDTRDRLLASLPVKVGGKLAEGSVYAITEALKTFDEHLTFTVTLGSSGEATIHITRPRI